MENLSAWEIIEILHRADDKDLLAICSASKKLNNICHSAYEIKDRLLVLKLKEYKNAEWYYPLVDGKGLESSMIWTAGEEEDDYDEVIKLSKRQLLNNLKNYKYWEEYEDIAGDNMREAIIMNAMSDNKPDWDKINNYSKFDLLALHFAII